jgi:hypothetical protein
MPIHYKFEHDAYRNEVARKYAYTSDSIDSLRKALDASQQHRQDLVDSINELMEFAQEKTKSERIGSRLAKMGYVLRPSPEIKRLMEEIIEHCKAALETNPQNEL